MLGVNCVGLTTTSETSGRFLCIATNLMQPFEVKMRLMCRHFSQPRLLVKIPRPSNYRIHRSQLWPSEGEGRGQRAEGRRQKAEGRRQRSEVREQRSENRGQRTEVREQRAENRV